MLDAPTVALLLHGCPKAPLKNIDRLKRAQNDTSV
jgi:hypothetical protein